MEIIFLCSNTLLSGSHLMKICLDLNGTISWTSILDSLIHSKTPMDFTKKPDFFLLTQYYASLGRGKQHMGMFYFSPSPSLSPSLLFFLSCCFYFLCEIRYYLVINVFHLTMNNLKLQANLKLLGNPLSQPSKYWNYRSKLSHLGFSFLRQGHI